MPDEQKSTQERIEREAGRIGNQVSTFAQNNPQTVKYIVVAVVFFLLGLWTGW